jgi:phenylalanyl-tRNA synthetase beta chain
VANGLGKWSEEFRSPSEKKKKGFKIPLNGSPSPITISVKDKDVCSRYMSVYMTGIEVQDSPDWMKKRLSACGIRPLANIIDITNYVMLELGMPLHAFDPDRVNGRKWTMRKSVKGEKITTLDEKEHELMDDVIVMEDGNEIFDLCGIMGGLTSGINKNTNKILLHSPVYNPTLIRRAMRGLGQISDAAIIYEKGVDDELAEDGLKRAVRLVLELCPGAKVASGITDIRNVKPEKRQLTLRLSQISRLLGADIKPLKIEKILKELGFKLTKSKGGYKTLVPSWRLGDIRREADLIEEIARVYGYDNIPLTTPVIDITPAPVNSRRSLERQIKDRMTAYGFDEIYTFAFLGPELLAKCGMGKDAETIEIANPISSDMSLMRQSLLPRLLETIMGNLRYSDKFRIFELSSVYHKKGEAREERSALTAATVGEDFRALQGVVENMGFKVLPARDKAPQYHPGRIADLAVGEKIVGRIAEIHPGILKNFDIKTRIVTAEVDMEAVHAMNIERKPGYSELPKYPSVKLDISILIPKKNLAADYFKAIESAGKTLITKVEIIDEYSGDKIADGKRSLTYSITYQAPDRTLTDEEVNKIHSQVIGRLKDSGAEIR